MKKYKNSLLITILAFIGILSYKSIAVDTAKAYVNYRYQQLDEKRIKEDKIIIHRGYFESQKHENILNRMSLVYKLNHPIKNKIHRNVKDKSHKNKVTKKYISNNINSQQSNAKESNMSETNGYSSSNNETSESNNTLNEDNNVSNNDKYNNTTSTPNSNDNNNPNDNINSSAANQIAQAESTNNYNAVNGRYYGKYQLDISYLNGDLSPENQDRTFNNYVNERYGSMDNALAFRQTHGWY